jgi:hypothetical protein
LRGKLSSIARTLDKIVRVSLLACRAGLHGLSSKMG